jgi:retron-type reverse transcriptase
MPLLNRYKLVYFLCLSEIFFTTKGTKVKPIVSQKRNGAKQIILCGLATLRETCFFSHEGKKALKIRKRKDSSAVVGTPTAAKSYFLPQA